MGKIQRMPMQTTASNPRTITFFMIGCKAIIAAGYPDLAFYINLKYGGKELFICKEFKSNISTLHDLDDLAYNKEASC